MIWYLNLDMEEHCPLLRLEEVEDRLPIFPQVEDLLVEDPLVEDPLEVVVDRRPEVVEDYPQISLEMEEDRRRMRPMMVEILPMLITTSTLGSTTSTLLRRT